MQEFDITVSNTGLLEVDESLRTMVLLALFTDRRADPEDDAQDDSDRRGWWGDSYPEVAGDEFGSRLWMLEGKPAAQSSIEFATQEVERALESMIEDGIVERIEQEWELDGAVLKGRVGIVRPADPSVLWIPLWNVTLSG